MDKNDVTGVEEKEESEKVREKQPLTSGAGSLTFAKRRGIDPLEIDVIIRCTVTPDMFFPATANIISEKVGAKNAFQF